ncbi:unnamed protein product, partial [Symbiodinium microadriaticum]
MWNNELSGLDAKASAAMETCRQLWQHFVCHAIELSISVDIVLASYPSVIEESQACAANVARTGTFQSEDVSALALSIKAGSTIALIDPLPSKVKQLLQFVDETNLVIAVFSSPMGYPRDLVYYEVQKKYELENKSSIELCHFRNSDDVVPSPVPALPGKAVNTAFPVWALLTKRSSPEPMIPCYSDAIGQDWMVSFSATIGFFDKNAIEPWINLGFVVTRDKTFFKKQTADKMYSITLSINSPYLEGAASDPTSFYGQNGVKRCGGALRMPLSDITPRYMLPLTDLGLDGNLLAQFDEACVASIGTFAVEDQNAAFAISFQEPLVEAYGNTHQSTPANDGPLDTKAQLGGKPFALLAAENDIEENLLHQSAGTCFPDLQWVLTDVELYQGTVPHPVLLQRVHAQPPADILFGNPYLPVEVSLSSFEYEAIVSHTDSPLSVVLQVDWRQGVAQCLIGVGQRAPVELATLPLAQAVLVALLHRLGGAFIPEVFWNSTVGDMQPEADFLQLLHTAFDAAFPREAVVSLYQATWHEARSTMLANENRCELFSVTAFVTLPRTISALLAKGPVCFQETNWTVRDVERASVTFPRAAVISTLAVPNGSSGVTILVPAPFKVESQHEVLPGYVLSVESSHFTHKCEIVSVYAHADRFQEVSAALQTYLAARNTQVELFVAGDFNSMREKQPALWDLFVSEGLLKQVSLHVDTYRSGPHASQLDLILHNEHAEGARKLTSRVFWPRSIPNGHALVSLRACKARLLANDVRAVKYSAIPLRAFKQHATAPTSGIPSRPAHPAQLRLLRMRYLVSHKPSLADLQGLFHVWWKREMPSHNLAVQEGLLGALPYLLRRQRLQPRAQDYLIPRNIYETFRHLLSDHRWSEDGRAARLTAVEMQQVDILHHILHSGDPSAGPDGCPYECYRSLPTESAAALHQHLVDIVLGDAPPPTQALTFIPKADSGNFADNFRPLDMPDTAARIIDSAVFSKLMQSFCPILHQSQALVSSMKEAPANYLAIQDALWEQGSGAVALLTDMAKAFERVNPGWLLHVLRRLLAPQWVCQYVVHLLYG